VGAQSHNRKVQKGAEDQGMIDLEGSVQAALTDALFLGGLCCTNRLRGFML